MPILLDVEIPVKYVEYAGTGGRACRFPEGSSAAGEKKRPPKGGLFFCVHPIVYSGKEKPASRTVKSNP